MAKFSTADTHYMQLAINLAKRGSYTTTPNPNVGCVLVKNDEIIGQGYHIKAGTEHAEIHALKQAGKQANGATAYVTLEPCSHFGRTPPCAQALIDAGVSKVIAAMVDPNPQVAGRGLAMLEQAGIKVSSGLLEDQAKAINKGFLKRMQHNMPYVVCKLAASLDGKIAMASGESKWITGEPARADVQKIRAQSCAIITSATSVVKDNAQMTVRANQLPDSADYFFPPYFEQGEVRQPLRVIIDTQQQLTPDFALFKTPSPILIIGSKVEKQHTWPHFVEHCVLPLADDNRHLALKPLLQLLAQREINQVLVEAGAHLAGAFIEQNLVDELVLYQAPKLLGADGQSLVQLPHTKLLSQAKQLKINEITVIGEDIKIVAQVKSNAH